LILGAGFGAFAYLKETRPERPTAEIRERVWRVDVETVEPRLLAPVLSLYGRVEAPDLLRAAAPAPARVARVLVRDGDRVEQGQLLVELDARDFEPRLDQARSEVRELEAQMESELNRHETDKAALDQERKLLRIAEDGVERAQRLTRQRVGSETDLDTAEQALARQTLTVSNREMSIADFPARTRALEARLQRARARLDETALEYERARVVAPYDGVVGDVEVSAGDQVRANDVLLRLYALDGLEVRARIPAPYQAEIAAALADSGSLPATAPLGDGELALKLVRLAGEAAASGVDGLFEVGGDPGGLRAGQMLSIRLRRPARDSAVAVPFSAIYGGNRVYAFADGRISGIDVEALGSWFAEDGAERLLVRSERLRDGDRLVVTHLPNAIDGLRVETVQ
jgi:multidrug efflux pump subunit AcrA (membrane-fusion protein)